MDPISIATACLTVAKSAYQAVNLVSQERQQWIDAPFNIECLHTEISNAKAILTEIVPVMRPRLAFAPQDLVIAINRSFSTCKLALERIKERADEMNAASRRGRFRYVWQGGCERQRDQLKDQLAGLQQLIVLIPYPQDQQSAIALLSSNGQLSTAGLEDDSADDETATSLLDSSPRRNSTGITRRRSRNFFRSTKAMSRALIQAALDGDVTEMERLYEQGADVKYQSRKQPPDNDGMTALHAAAKDGHYRAVEFLVQRGANVNALMVNKFTPLHRAATAQHIEVARYLIRRGGANVNAQDAQGQTPLFKSDGQMTKMLLSAQANPNVVDGNVNTPLHHAAHDIHVGAIRLLKETNANVNIRNRELKTALWLVCDRTNEFNLDKSLEIVDLLLQRRADPNIACHQGKPPLELCIQDNGSELVGRLIKAGADATFRTQNGDTLLHTAATLQSATIMCQLLPWYTNFDTPAQPELYTPLHAAVREASFACAEKLLESGASVTVREHRGMTALHLAAGARTDDFVKVLLRYNANPHAYDYYKRTPLFYVDQSPAVCAYLLNAGASLTATDRVQNSPLHHLTRKADPAVIKVLLERGISVTAINQAGRTPLEELCADESGWQGVSNSSTLSPKRLKSFHLLLKHKVVVTPACRASIARWNNVTLRNALTSQLPWRSPNEVLADNPVLSGAMIVASLFFASTRKFK
ncbi:ankyrin repeat-containing domain protein [Usnea florida]